MIECLKKQMLVLSLMALCIAPMVFTGIIWPEVTMPVMAVIGVSPLFAFLLGGWANSIDRANFSATIDTEASRS